MSFSMAFLGGCILKIPRADGAAPMRADGAADGGDKIERQRSKNDGEGLISGSYYDKMQLDGSNTKNVIGRRDALPCTE